jgi:GNAT superfamily N-acetyltransferase
MTARPEPRLVPALPRVELRAETPDVAAYRELYTAVGGEWLWFSRLAMDDARLAAILADPATAIHVLYVEDEPAGLLELDDDGAGNVELAFFGLTAEHVGAGVGRWLMNEAMRLAWGRPTTRRVWVHTCTFDHPAAVAFYRRSGFEPYAYAVEITDDPRLIGVLPRDAARHVPVIG